jgi:hypothetical protein
MEAGLALGVLLSTGLLTSLGPARQPTQILLEPAQELRLEAEPLRTNLPFSSGRDGVLELNPGRVGANTYQIIVLDGGKPVSGVRRVYLELTPRGLATGPAAPAASVVELTASGPGSFVGRGLAPSADGLWQARVRVYLQDGSIDTAAVTFQATSQWGAIADPDAVGLLADAARAMAGARAVRIVESLENGAGGIVLDDYALVAPDRQEVVNPAGEDVRQIGPTVYVRQPGSGIWHAEPGATYEWPGGTYEYLTQGVGAIRVGRGTILGYDCDVVAFYSPRVSGVYEEWIGEQDHRIHQEVMAAPSHFMVNLYYDFDAPARIMAPGAK